MFFAILLTSIFTVNLTEGFKNQNLLFKKGFDFLNRMAVNESMRCGALPEEDESDYITYPWNPGFPGNYSNQLNMVNYFSNLSNHFPMNKKGSCGFVAIAQILSYFDTFYDDTIIPEQYEDNCSLSSTNINACSPGTLKDSLITPFNNDTMTNHSFANATYNECFDSKLMVDYNNDTSWYFHQTNTNNATSFINSLSWADSSYVFDGQYGQHNLETGIRYDFNSDDPNHTNYRFEVSEVMVQMNNQSDINEFNSIAKAYSDSIIENVAEIIDDGFPVLLNINHGYQFNNNPSSPNYTEYGMHAVVAYDYEIVDGETIVYCNFGHENPLTFHAPYNDGPFKYAYAYVPVFYNSSIHHHSDNYLIDNKLYCGCSHHTHSLTYQYIDQQKHSVSCPCGYIECFNHTDNWFYSCCTDGPTPGVL